MLGIDVSCAVVHSHRWRDKSPIHADTASGDMFFDDEKKDQRPDLSAATALPFALHLQHKGMPVFSPGWRAAITTPRLHNGTRAATSASHRDRGFDGVRCWMSRSNHRPELPIYESSGAGERLASFRPIIQSRARSFLFPPCTTV